MNRKIQAIKYLLLDGFSAATAWFLFFLYRKKVVETQWFDIDTSLLDDERFRLGVISITLFWILLYALMGQYEHPYRKSRLIELKRTIVQSFVGVFIIFFVALLDDVIPSYKNYYSGLVILYGVHFTITYTLRFLLTTSTIRRIHRREIGFKNLIVGSGESALVMYENLTSRAKSAGNLIIGFVNGMDEGEQKLDTYIPYLGSYKDLELVIKEQNICLLYTSDAADEL